MDIQRCPACGSTEGLPIGSQEINGFSVETASGNFAQENYSIKECASCGLLYKTRTLSADDFAAYYEAVDFRKWEAPILYPTERAVLRSLENLPANSKILDFGCSTGRLLGRLVNCHQCYGYEVNELAAAEAKDKGIRVLSSDELASTPHSFFDAVVMMDVFEHLSEPMPILASLVAQIKPGSNLIIATGDGDYAACRRDPAQFWYFRVIEHVIMMTRRHAAWLTDRLAMDLRQWKNVSHYDSTWWRKSLQHVQQFAYWQFRQGKPIIKSLLRLLPGVRKAERWQVAPGFSAGKDHVIAVFVKPAASA